MSVVLGVSKGFNRWSRGEHFRGVKLFCMILCEYMTLSICQNPSNFTAQRVNLKVWNKKIIFKNNNLGGQGSHDGMQTLAKQSIINAWNNFTEGDGVNVLS